MMEKLGTAAIAVLILIVIALLSLLVVAKSKAEERVLVDAYCLDRSVTDHLLDAELKGPKALSEARKAVWKAGTCKKLDYPELARVLSSETRTGRVCDWRVLLVQIKSEPLPVWTSGARNCGKGI